MSDQSSNRPLTSKAVTYKALGGPEVIQFVERTVRAPAAGEVRIEVKAAAVNPADILFRDPGWPAAAKRQGIKVIADANSADAELVRSYGADIMVKRGPGFAEAIRRELPDGGDALLDTASLGEKSFGAIRDGGIYIPVRGWGDKPAERGIKIKADDGIRCPRTYEWLELLRNMVAAGEIKLRVVEEYAPTKTADAQRALVAGSPRGRPVIPF